MTEKHCATCAQSFPVESFPLVKRKGREPTPSPHCRKCLTNAQRESRIKTKMRDMGLKVPEKFKRGYVFEDLEEAEPGPFFPDMVPMQDILKSMGVI